MAENPKAWTQLIRHNCRSYPTEHSLVGRSFRHFICDTKSPSPSFGKSRGVVECFLLFEQTEWKVLTQQELSETFWKLKTLTINSPFAEIGWSLASFFSQISIILLGNSNMEVKYLHKCSSDALNFRQISPYADTISITLLTLLKSRKLRFTMLSKCINCTLWV